MLKITKALLAVALFLSVGTAYAARPHAVLSTEEQKQFVLDSDVVVQDYVNFNKHPANITFSKCTYYRTHSDTSGDYYTGDDGCFRLVNWQDDGASTNGLGGIWMPSNNKKQPRIYMVVGTSPKICGALGPLLCLISKLENGRFKLLPGKAKPEAVLEMKITSLTRSATPKFE